MVGLHVLSAGQWQRQGYLTGRGFKVRLLLSQPERKLISVAKNDLRPGRCHLLSGQPFDRRLRAHRHEHRGLKRPMRRRELTQSGRLISHQEVE